MRKNDMRYVDNNVVNNSRVKVLHKKRFDNFDLYLYDKFDYVFVIDKYTSDSVIFDIYKNVNRRKSEDKKSKYIEGLIIDVDILLMILEMIHFNIILNINTNNNKKYIYFTVCDGITDSCFLRIYQLVMFHDILLKKLLGTKSGSFKTKFNISKIIDNKSKEIHHNELLKDKNIFNSNDNRKSSLYLLDKQIHGKVHGNYRKFFNSNDSENFKKIQFQLNVNEDFFRSELNLITRKDYLKNYYVYEDLFIK